MQIYTHSASTLFAAASSEYLQITDVPALTEPLTMAAWMRPDAVDAQRCIMFCGDSGTTGDWFSIGTIISISHKAHAWHRKDAAASTIGAATGTTALQSGVWYHLSAVFTSSASRSVYVDGAFQAENTTSVVTDWTNNVYAVGRFSDSTPSSYFDGAIAHACVWDQALTDGEIAMLYNGGIGLDPRQVRAHALRSYHPMNNEAFMRDVVGRLHWSTIGGTKHGVPSPQGYAIDVPRRWANQVAAPAAGNSNLLLLGVG